MLTRFLTGLTCFLLLVFAVVLKPTGTGAQIPGLDDPGSGHGSGNVSGGLIAVAERVEAGAIPIGSTAQVVVRFRNEGVQAIQTGVIRLYPSSNVSASIALNQCEAEPLSSGAECAIALSVKGLQTGSWRVEMLMTHNGRTRLVTTTLSGSVESNDDAAARQASDLEAVPAEVDFESLSESQTLTKPITLRNITSNPVEIKQIYIDSSEVSGYSLKTECKKLGPGQACIAVVNWSPQMAGRASGVLVIKHDGPTGLTSILLDGTYDPKEVPEAMTFPKAVPGKGLLVSSQQEIDFGADIQTSSTITVSLVNAGDAPLNINDIRISGSDNGLGFKDRGCGVGTVLDPIEACPLTITWSPTRLGSVTDDVQILHNGARGVLVLPIRGEASATVSQDQKAIVLNGQTASDGDFLSAPMTPDEIEAALDGKGLPGARHVINPSSLLDGYKITSFGKDRAIVNGPGGSRLVFDQEEVSIGGLPWFVVIKNNGIEFLHKGQRVLLLFDKSLASINRVQASSGETVATSGGATDSSTAESATAASTGN